MTMNPPPPIPEENGSVTPRTPAAAIAASTALPPSRSACTAAPVAVASTLDAAPPVPVAVDVSARTGAAAQSAAARVRTTARRRRMPPPLPGHAGPHAGEEVEHPPPRVGARVGELVVLAVEEGVRRARVHDDLVVRPARVERLLELGDRLDRDARVVAAEQAEEGQLHVRHGVERRRDDARERALARRHHAPVE